MCGQLCVCVWWGSKIILETEAASSSGMEMMGPQALGRCSPHPVGSLCAIDTAK